MSLEERAREISFEVMGYRKDQSIAGMAAKYLSQLLNFEKALLTFAQEARKSTIKKCANIARGYDPDPESGRYIADGIFSLLSKQGKSK